MSEDTEGATTGRGRPRPETTIARDKEVLEFLTNAGAPQTRKQIAEGTSKPGNEIYLSLYRLSRSNQIKREGSLWSVVTAEQPAPAA